MNQTDCRKKDVHNVDTATESMNLPGVTVGCAQALGHRYEHNEDSLFTFTSRIITSNSAIECGCFCVADGMGGYDSGEVASAMAVHKMGDFVIRKVFLPVLCPGDYFSQEPILEVLEEAIQSIHEEISEKVDGGGTTLTSVVLMGDYLTIAHVGDSRAYYIDQKGKIEKLTEDQTLVQRLVTMGQLTEEEARSYPQRNVLYYALGRGDRIEPFLATRKIQKGSFVVVCSDGLWEILDDKTILGIVSSAEQPESIANELVQYANDHGAMDNVTVVVAKI